MSARVFSVADIARQIGGEVIGDGSLTIHAVRNVGTAREGHIAIAGDRRNGLSELNTSGASALIVPRELAPPGRTVIVVENPREALVAVLRLFEDPAAASGVHPTAVIAESAIVASSAFIGAGAVIGERASVGDRAQIRAGVVIGDDVRIGADSVIHPAVVLYANTSVGDRVIVHSGTVIGSDGFGYRRLPSGEQEKIPHFGRVVIEDDVEIGANCAIDRATIEETRIGRGTKIDNLVQIGHNSEIGSHACILGQVGISGSVKIGNFSILAGQAGVADHVTLGDGTVVGAQAGVHHDLAGGRWLNTPAIPAERAGRIYPIIEHLPEYRERIRTLERRCQELERKLEQLIAELTAAQRL